MYTSNSFFRFSLLNDLNVPLLCWFSLFSTLESHVCPSLWESFCYCRGFALLESKYLKNSLHSFNTFIKSGIWSLLDISNITLLCSVVGYPSFVTLSDAFHWWNVNTSYWYLNVNRHSSSVSVKFCPIFKSVEIWQQYSNIQSSASARHSSRRAGTPNGAGRSCPTHSKLRFHESGELVGVWIYFD